MKQCGVQQQKQLQQLDLEEPEQDVIPAACTQLKVCVY